MDFEFTASCRCGEVMFSCQEQPVIHLSCHCSDCRDATSDSFSNIAFYKQEISKISGSVCEKSFVAESGNQTTREYCPHCDTIMFDKSAGFPDLVGVFSKNIRQKELGEPRCHVWVVSKLPHIELALGSKIYNKGIQ